MQNIANNSELDQGKTLLPIGYKLGQYEIESVLAIGDFRITYYAWDHRGDRNVVIHEYYPRSLCVRGEDTISVTSENEERFTDYEFGLSEFLLEARLVSQIRSPYLPSVIEYREANGTGYLVSEYDDGCTLRDKLDKDPGQLTDKELNELLSAGLQGLRELHARNLLHTSVSPNNLFIRYHGHPIVLGQGLARYRLAQYTKTYTISLAQGYTPLEQYGLDGNIGPWSDLYALGASLYECVAGVRPVDASTRHTAIIKGEQDPLTPAVEIGNGKYSNLLLSNIDWMLKPYIEDRPDSADLMLGVVSFQKSQQFRELNVESANNPTSSSESESQSSHKGTKTLASKSSLMREEKTPQPALVEPAIRDNGRYFYWGLALFLLAFLGFTGYQIYKHELTPKPEVTASSIQETDNLFNPEALSPAGVDPDNPDQQAFESTTEDQAQSQTISRQSDEQRREFYQGIFQEEEVQKRVKEELKALEEQQLTEQQIQQDAQQREIEALLDQAREAMDKVYLLKPEGESAFDYYSSVLTIEPLNQLAISGLNEIADAYFNFAIGSIERKDPDEAGIYLKNLIKVRPDDPRIDGFLQQITDLKAQLKLEETEAKLKQEQELALKQQELELKQKLQAELETKANEQEKAQAPEPTTETTQPPAQTTESVVNSNTLAPVVDSSAESGADESNPEVENSDQQPVKLPALNRTKLSIAYKITIKVSIPPIYLTPCLKQLIWMKAELNTF